MNKMLLEEDVLSKLPKPDSKTVEMYNKAFEEIDKNLKKNIQKVFEEERKRIQETAKRAETYMLA